MSINFLASQVPAPTVTPPPVSIAECDGSGTTSPTGPTFNPAVVSLLKLLNQLSAHITNAGYGSGNGNGILTGLGLLNLGGLKAGVSPGFAMIGGSVEIGGFLASIGGATNATPVVVNTLAPHGLSNAQLVTISGVLGNLAANGTRYAKTTGYTATSFALYSDAALTTPIAGTGVYTSGGVLDSTPTVILPDNTAFNFIFAMQDGTIVHQTSLTPPSNACTLLGTLTTSGGVITAIDYSGVVYIQDGQRYRETADRGYPSDTPAAGIHVTTKTLAGTFKTVNGVHKAIDFPVNVETLAGDRTLTNLDVPRQVISSGGANRNIILPSTSPGSGTPPFELVHGDNAGAFKLVFKDPTNTLVVATLYPGMVCKVPPVIVAGVAAWPTVPVPTDVPQAYNLQTITGTLSLTPGSPRVQRLTCAGAQSVLLPQQADLAWFYDVYNDNASGSGIDITLKDYLGSPIATITPQMVARVRPTNAAGTPGWPTTVTPVDPES